MPTTHHLEVHVDAVHVHLPHRASVAVEFHDVDARVATEGEIRQGLLRAIPVGLATLGRVDLSQADTHGFLIHEQGQGVAVGDAHHAPGQRRRARLTREQRAQRREHESASSGAHHRLSWRSRSSTASGSDRSQRT